MLSSIIADIGGDTRLSISTLTASAKAKTRGLQDKEVHTIAAASMIVPSCFGEFVPEGLEI
jgi:hypothetical protein